MRSRSQENLKSGRFTLLFCEDGKEMYQNVKQTCRAMFCSLNLLFCGILVAVVVLVA